MDMMSAIRNRLASMPGGGIPPPSQVTGGTPPPAPIGAREKSPLSAIEQAISALQEIVNNPQTDEDDKTIIERAINTLRGKGSKKGKDEESYLSKKGWERHKSSTMGTPADELGLGMERMGA